LGGSGLSSAGWARKVTPIWLYSDRSFTTKSTPSLAASKAHKACKGLAAKADVTLTFSTQAFETNKLAEKNAQPITQNGRNH
jgi:hypothetical protein